MFLNSICIYCNTLSNSSNFWYLYFFLSCKILLFNSTKDKTLWELCSPPFKAQDEQISMPQSSQKSSKPLSPCFGHFLKEKGSSEAYAEWLGKFASWKPLRHSSQIHFLHSLQYSAGFLWVRQTSFCFLSRILYVSFNTDTINDIDTWAYPGSNDFLFKHSLQHNVIKSFLSVIHLKLSRNMLWAMHTPHSWCWHEKFKVFLGSGIGFWQNSHLFILTNALFFFLSFSSKFVVVSWIFFSSDFSFFKSFLSFLFWFVPCFIFDFIFNFVLKVILSFYI